LPEQAEFLQGAIGQAMGFIEDEQFDPWGSRERV
jgi:hypothetical protein